MNNTRRILLFSCIVFSLVCLGLYSCSAGQARDQYHQDVLSGCLSSNATCPKTPVSFWAQITFIGKEHFIVNVRTKKGQRSESIFDRKHDLTILGEVFQLIVGDVILIRGVFISPQTLEMEAYGIEVAWFRETKYAISLLGLVLTCLLWLRTFNFSFKKFSFLLRRDS